MEVDYYSKYLKYKSKYIELKKKLGGGLGSCQSIKKDGSDCDCIKYTSDTNKPTGKKILIGLELINDYYCKCGHNFYTHNMTQEEELRNIY